MRRYAVSLALAASLVLSGCGGGDSSEEPGAEPTAAATPTGTNSPTPSPSATAEPVTVVEFCGLVRTVTTAEGNERQQAVLALLQRGFPTELSAEQTDGLQVLLDLAPRLTGFRDSLRAYRDLGSGQRADLRSFGWFITRSCGRDYVADLLPDLPDFELPSLPDLPELPSLPGR